MPKNRKYQTAAVRFGPALKAFLLCALIGGSGVGYVWQKSQIQELGRQIRTLEAQLRELQTQNNKARIQLARLRSPLELKKRAEELKLGLVEPQQSQIWRLPEPSASPKSGSGDQYFAHQAVESGLSR